MTSKLKLEALSDLISTRTRNRKGKSGSVPKSKPPRVRTKSGNEGERRGSKPGEPRRGGRQKGTPNKATEEREKHFAEAQAIAAANLSSAVIDQLDPLDTLVWVMRWCLKQGFLFKAAEMASLAAPYCNPRLSTVVQHVDLGGGDTDKMTDAQLHARLAQIHRQMAASTAAADDDSQDSDDDGVPPKNPGSKLQ